MPASTIVARNLVERFRADPVIDTFTFSLAGGPLLFPVHSSLPLADWLATGVAASLLFFRWDPSRPRHARSSIR